MPVRRSIDRRGTKKKLFRERGCVFAPRCCSSNDTVQQRRRRSLDLSTTNNGWTSSDRNASSPHSDGEDRSCGRRRTPTWSPSIKN